MGRSALKQVLVPCFVVQRARARWSRGRGAHALAPAQDRDGQHNSGSLLPVGALSFGVKQVQMRYRVPLVISGEDGCCWGRHRRLRGHVAATP